MKSKFKGITMSTYLSNSIDSWQRAEIEKIAKRAYLLGKKHQKSLSK